MEDRNIFVECSQGCCLSVGPRLPSFLPSVCPANAIARAFSEKLLGNRAPAILCRNSFPSVAALCLLLSGLLSRLTLKPMEAGGRVVCSQIKVLFSFHVELCTAYQIVQDASTFAVQLHGRQKRINVAPETLLNSKNSVDFSMTRNPLQTPQFQIETVKLAFLLPINSEQSELGNVSSQLHPPNIDIDRAVNKSQNLRSSGQRLTAA